MDSKYIACLMLFLSFTVISSGEPEHVMAGSPAQPAEAQNPRAVACDAVYQPEQARSVSGSTPPHAIRAALKNGGEATEEVLQNLVCLLASL